MQNCSPDTLRSSLRRYLMAACLALLVPAWALPGFSPNDPIVYKRPSSPHVYQAKLFTDRQNWSHDAYSLTRGLIDNPDNVRIAVKMADAFYRLGKYKRTIDVLPI